jgi:hypothetical protein
MWRALSLTLALLLLPAATAEAEAGPLITCERQARGPFGLISGAALLSGETGALSFVHANWYVDGLAPDGGPGLTVAYFSPTGGDLWTPQRRSLMVSYEGPRPAQALWASITLDDGDSRIARAVGSGPDVRDEGDRYADFSPAFADKVLSQREVTVEVASADGTVLASRDIGVRREEAEAALRTLVAELRLDAAGYRERCRPHGS